MKLFKKLRQHPLLQDEPASQVYSSDLAIRALPSWKTLLMILKYSQMQIPMADLMLMTLVISGRKF